MQCTSSSAFGVVSVFNFGHSDTYVVASDFCLICSSLTIYGTPLQYFCLENPMDRGAWQAAVHGVATSWIQLSDFTFTFHFHALEKEMATHSSVLAWRIPGTGSLKGCCLWGCTESDTTEATQQQLYMTQSIFLDNYFLYNYPYIFFYEDSLPHC